MIWGTFKAKHPNPWAPYTVSVAVRSVLIEISDQRRNVLRRLLLNLCIKEKKDQESAGTSSL